MEFFFHFFEIGVRIFLKLNKVSLEVFWIFLNELLKTRSLSRLLLCSLLDWLLKNLELIFSFMLLLQEFLLDLFD